MAATHNEKEIKTRYPVEKGLTARTTSQTGRVMNLVASRSNVLRREVHGIR